MFIRDNLWFPSPLRNAEGTGTGSGASATPDAGGVGGAPSAEGQSGVSDAASQGAGSAQAPEPDNAAGGTEAPAGDKPKDPPWWERRMSSMAEAKRKAEAEARQAQEELARLRQQISPPEAQGQQPQATVPIDESRINAMVEERLALQQFNSTADAIYRNGLKSFGQEFDQKLQLLRSACGGVLPAGLTAAVVELQNDGMDAAKVLMEMTKDMDFALALASEANPVRQTARLANFAAKVANAPAAAPRVSQAPPPVSPQAGGPGATAELAIDDPKLPIADWMKLRKQQMAAR